jgi:hypothetical protein
MEDDPVTSGSALMETTSPGGAALSRRDWAVLLLLLAVASAGPAWSFWHKTEAPAIDAHSVTPAELEATYGLKVALVAESGGGGMIDFRFRITDADKAQHLFHDDLPMLIADSGDVISMNGIHHQPDIADGRQYFLLFGNSGGVVRAGETVSVVIGDLRLDDYPVSG